MRPLIYQSFGRGSYQFIHLYKLFGIVSLPGKQGKKRVLENQLGIEISDEDFELASLTGECTEFDHRENKVILTNKRELAQELKKFDGVNLGDMSLCSNALSILGLAHGTSLSVAAGILGVAWYIAVPIVAAAGAIWVAGSIACP